jgi:hypothetical protein
MEKFDKQLTGMAGEYLAIGKLFKKGLQAAITVGNAKSVDIIAYNPKNDKNYNVQVKTSRKENNFRILEGDIKPEQVYVFIFLNNFENNENYFIIKGSKILKDVKKYFIPSKTAINYKTLMDYKDNWCEFDK